MQTRQLPRRRYALPPEESDKPHFDVLIVGSGPVGCTFARMLVDGDPTKKILMVDLGAQLSEKPGANAKNVYLYNYNEDGLDTLSQVVRGELTYTSRPVQAPWPENLDPISQRTPPVKYQINGGNPDQNDWENMPAAASSFNVGGMAAHWTCCTPRPAPAERIPFFEQAEWDSLIARGEALLHTNQDAFAESFRGKVIKKTLAKLFDKHLPDGRKVQMLPLACQRHNSTWVEWTGADTILGPLAEPDKISTNQFQLWSETVCRKLLLEGNRVVGADLEHLPSLTKQTVYADTVIVAANALYTPQLLWKSGICPAALGHYLNDQPMVFCQIVLKQELLDEVAALWGDAPDPDVDPVPIPLDDPIPNVWIPFSDPEHPYHCQIHRDAFPYSILPGNLGIDRRAIVDLRWFTRKELRFEDHISFSDKYFDLYDMPQITFHYTFSEADQQTVHAAMEDMVTAANALGGFLPGAEPRFLERGSSLHFQGTHRMGETAEAEDSVCGPDSKVWGLDNLYLGGNGMIPTSTACNPTLTSVALAIRACDKILEGWAADT